MPNDWSRITDRVIIIVVVAVVLYDVAAVLMGGGAASVSARLQHHAIQYPVIPFAIGMLAAHWFWPVFGVGR